MSKKGLALTELPSIFWVFVAVALAGFVFFILSGALQDTQTSGTLAYNATQNIVEAGYNITEQMPTAGTIAGVMIIVGIVGAGVFYGSKMI